MDRSGIRSPAQTPEAKDKFRKDLVRQTSGAGDSPRGLAKTWAGDLEIPWSPGNNWKSRKQDTRRG